MKELNQLCGLGVLELQPKWEWASPSFITAKKDRTVRFLTDFREVNKRLVRKPFPIPKISTVLQELEGFTYATTLDLNMGIKPQQKKVQAILAISPPKDIKDLGNFLGMVQYYRDLWARRSEVLAPLTSLVGECGHTKVTRANQTKKRPWYSDTVHQKAFDDVKTTIANDVVLAYPDFSREFEVYTDASSTQLGSVITEAHQKYSVTELELLAIVETLKEFKGMLWGQRLKVYTDHKNLIQDALGLRSDRVYQWRLLLEDFGPKLFIIKAHIMLLPTSSLV
eukprot:CCRYP_012972-RA/>CCRYP_012972-RA protein AED:0.26 eAED:0.46 QI:0/0/0/1/0/0/3/0/280